jgi:hypothetical protein
MSRDEDRIPVSTNGRHGPSDEADEADDADEAAPAAPAVTSEVAPDPRISLSPGQAAVGFGIVASLILLILRRRRRGPG